MSVSMELSKNGLEQIKLREGFRKEAYLDTANIWTIGYGTTRIAGVPVKKGDTIDVGKATACLLEDCKCTVAAVNRLVKVQLTQNQFDALVSFVYNLGAAALEHSTLLRYLNVGRYKSAADQILQWVYSGGKVTPGLVTRRKSEWLQFNS